MSMKLLATDPETAELEEVCQEGTDDAVGEKEGWQQTRARPVAVALLTVVAGAAMVGVAMRPVSGIVAATDGKGLVHDLSKSLLVLSSLKWSNGDSYTGRVQDGRANGWGTYKFHSGNVYKGDHKNGLADGWGTKTFADRRSSVHAAVFYSGHWKEDKRDGEGTARWSDGDVYTGHWKDGKMDGDGKYYCHCGYVYTGHWKDGKRDGDFNVKFPDGHTERSHWKDGKHVDGADTSRPDRTGRNC